MDHEETDYIVEILEVAVLMAMADLEDHHRTAAAVVVFVVAVAEPSCWDEGSCMEGMGWCWCSYVADLTSSWS